MGAFTAASIVFLCVFGGGVAGLAVGRRLPDHHLDTETRDVVRHVTGFVAAITALVLGLLVASAKTNYEQRNGYLRQIGADLVSLDRALAGTGDDGQQARALLRKVLQEEYDRLSSDGRLRGTGLDSPAQDPRMQAFHDQVTAIAPRTEAGRIYRDRAERLTENIAATRVLLTQDVRGSIPSPFLVILCFWPAMMFAGFGLFAKPNATVVSALLLGAVAVSGAVFLILELDRPLDGIMRLSTEPLRHAIGSMMQ